MSTISHFQKLEKRENISLIFAFPFFLKKTEHCLKNLVVELWDEYRAIKYLPLRINHRKGDIVKDQLPTINNWPY